MENNKTDLCLKAWFFYFNVGDRISFTYNSAECQGEIIEILYETETDNQFVAAVSFCNDWPALGNSTQVTLSNSNNLKLLYPQNW